MLWISMNTRDVFLTLPSISLTFPFINMEVVLRLYFGPLMVIYSLSTQPYDEINTTIASVNKS